MFKSLAEMAIGVTSDAKVIASGLYTMLFVVPSPSSPLLLSPQV